MSLMTKHTGVWKCSQLPGKMRPGSSWAITTLQSVSVSCCLGALSVYLVSLQTLVRKCRKQCITSGLGLRIIDVRK